MRKSSGFLSWIEGLPGSEHGPQVGEASGSAAGAIKDSQNDNHTRITCAQAASHCSRHYEKR